MKIVKNASLGLCAAVIASAVLVLGTGRAFAASTPTFSQTINAGTLATDIMNASRVSVATPAVAMSAKTYAFDCQSGASASTGTLGSNSERVYVSNPDAADNGWTLTIAASSGATASWSDGGTNNFDFNDANTSGCGDGADTDAYKGQLTINPAVSTLTADCLSCTTSNVTKGSSSAFSEGTTDSITLLNAASGSDDIWRGYMTGASASETIPGETPAASYTLGMTLTVTAL